MKIKNKITTNFDNSVTYTTSTGNDLKAEIRTLAREANKQITDFTINKIKYNYNECKNRI